MNGQFTRRKIVAGGVRKYRNRPTQGFASKREARRYAELKLLERAGKIANLRTQVKFELLPSQRVDGVVKERPLYYVADFVYCRDGKTVVEDAKGARTPEYVIKRKLMLWFRGIAIVEV